MFNNSYTNDEYSRKFKNLNKGIIMKIIKGDLIKLALKLSK